MSTSEELLAKPVPERPPTTVIVLRVLDNEYQASNHASLRQTVVDMYRTRYGVVPGARALHLIWDYRPGGQPVSVWSASVWYLAWTDIRPRVESFRRV